MTPEMAAVLADDRAYEAAYAKADVEALAALFHGGRRIHVRMTAGSSAAAPPIEACLRDASRINKGSKLSIHVDSVKPLTPDVVVEKGLDHRRFQNRR